MCLTPLNTLPVDNDKLGLPEMFCLYGDLGEVVVFQRLPCQAFVHPLLQGELATHVINTPIGGAGILFIVFWGGG